MNKLPIKEGLKRQALLLQRIMNGLSPKEAAYECGLAHSTAYRVLWQAGFYRCFLKKEEWQHILKRRIQKEATK
jgi:hypothetical protein